MRSQFQHDLWRDVCETRGNGRWVVKADDIGIAIVDGGAPVAVRAERLLAAGAKFTNEAARDVALAIAEHFGKEVGLFGSRQAPPARIAEAGEAQRGVIHRQIDILGKPVDRAKYFRERCPAL